MKPSMYLQVVIIKKGQVHTSQRARPLDQDVPLKFHPSFYKNEQIFLFTNVALLSNYIFRLVCSKDLVFICYVLSKRTYCYDHTSYKYQSGFLSNTKFQLKGI